MENPLEKLDYSLPRRFPVSFTRQREGDTSLYQTLLTDSRLYALLLKIDQYLAAEAQAKGCSCGGRLDSARYPRKPRGLPDELENKDDYRKRYSFCCALDGCRHRTTPPSFLFLGRRVFVGAVVVLVSALRHGPTPVRMAKLREWVGVSVRTVNRWRIWWQEIFVATPFWKQARGLFRIPLNERSLPLSLLEAFLMTNAKRRLIHLLRFISPLSTSPPRQES
jgi:hypothetical protein